MLSRLFSGRTSPRLGHAVTAVGDPNQAIYGWRGASVSNILNFADTFPAADRRRVRTFPLTVNRRSDRRILEVANRLAQPLYDKYGQVDRLRRRAGPTTASSARTSSRPTPTSWLAGRRVAGAHAAPTGWSEDRRAHPRQRPRRGRVRRPHRLPASRSRSSASPGCSGCPRSPRSWRRSTCSTTSPPTPRCSPCSPARAGRSARATCGCSAAGPRDRRRADGPTEAATVADQLARDRRRHRPRRDRRARRRARRPGDAAYSPEALERFALLAAELRMLRAYVGEPLLDVVRRIIDTTGVDVELASAVSPGGRGPPRQPRPVREGRGGVPGRRRRRLAAGAAGLPHRRGRPGQRPRRRHPDRGRLGQAAHRPPGQGPRVGLGVPGGRVRDPVPVQPVAHPVDLLAVDPPGAAARRRPRPAAAGRATTRPRSTPTARTPGPTTRRRSCGSATSPSPAPPTTCRVTSYLWSPRATPVRVRRPTSGWSASSSRPGASPSRDWLDKPAKGDPNPYDAVDPSRPWPSPAPARRPRCASRPRGWWSRPTRPPTTRAST